MKDDFFYSENAGKKDSAPAKRLYKAFVAQEIFVLVLAIACFVMGVIPFSIGIMIVWLLFAVVFIALFAVLHIYKDFVIVSYDYELVSDTLRVAKIINNKKRKLLCYIVSEDMHGAGRVGSDKFQEYLKMPDIRVINTAPEFKNVDVEKYYLYARSEREKILLVMECSKKFIGYIVSFKGRTILEKGFEL